MLPAVRNQDTGEWEYQPNPNTSQQVVYGWHCIQSELSRHLYNRQSGRYENVIYAAGNNHDYAKLPDSMITKLKRYNKTRYVRHIDFATGPMNPFMSTSHPDGDEHDYIAPTTEISLSTYITYYSTTTQAEEALCKLHTTANAQKLNWFPIEYLTQE